MSGRHATLSEVVGLDRLGGGDSAVHRLDARAKLVVTLIFVATVVSFDKYAVADLLPFAIFPIVLLAVSGIPARFVLRRLAVVAPFAVLVGMFNPLLDRSVLVQVGPLAITGGWLSFASILLRFALTIGALLILVATTPVPALGRAAESLGAPRAFVTQILSLYRYLFVLADEMQRMLRAYRLRRFEDKAPSWRVFAGILGQLLLRALSRARRIHEAMLCRGFDGHWRILGTPRMTGRDWLFAGGWVLAFAALRLLLPAQVLGRLLSGSWT